MRRVRAGQLFGLLLIPTPVVGVDSTPCVCGSAWLDGMGQFGMISPHGLAPFWLGTWTGPFPVVDMDWPVSLTYCPLVPQSDAFQSYQVHLCILGGGTLVRRARAGHLF